MQETTNNELRWSIIATLAWFGVLKRPLSVDEVSELAFGSAASAAAVQRELTALGDRVHAIDGYWSLSGQEVRYRTPESLRYHDQKWHRALRTARLLRHVPFVRMVAIANTVADRSARKESDIDVFIVIKDGRLFLARLMITLLLHVLRLRRHGRFVANRICLSFFITDAAFNLKRVALAPFDIYLLYWIAELRPVLDDGAYSEFRKYNRWALRRFPKVKSELAPYRPSKIAAVLEFLLRGILGTLIEKPLQRWQLGRIKRRPKNPDPDVHIVASPHILKFHEKDRRRMYREAWQDEMRRQGLRDRP